MIVMKSLATMMMSKLSFTEYLMQIAILGTLLKAGITLYWKILKSCPMATQELLMNLVLYMTLYRDLTAPHMLEVLFKNFHNLSSNRLQLHHNHGVRCMKIHLTHTEVHPTHMESCLIHMAVHTSYMTVNTSHMQAHNRHI